MKISKSKNLITRLIPKLATVIAFSVIGVFPLTPSSAQTPVIKSKAEDSLAKMLDYLNSKSSLDFQADINQDFVSDEGQKIQLGAVTSVKVRRPDKFYIDYQGDLRHVRFYYDGQTFTMEGLSNNVYANFPAPADVDNINAVVDKIGEKLDITLPLGEIISTDNDLESVRKRINSAIYVGESQVNGVICDHLAFTQDDLDWQIWIDRGEQPVPRKLLITYKEAPSSPQYSALLSDWNFESISAEDSAFLFEPAKDADKIDFVILEE